VRGELTGEEQVVNETDQIAEEHRTQARDDAQSERQQRQQCQGHLPTLLAVYHHCALMVRKSRPRSIPSLGSRQEFEKVVCERVCNANVSFHDLCMVATMNQRDPPRQLAFSSSS
jgi:hypothetical protein